MLHSMYYVLLFVHHANLRSDTFIAFNQTGKASSLWNRSPLQQPINNLNSLVFLRNIATTRTLEGPIPSLKEGGCGKSSISLRLGPTLLYFVDVGNHSARLRFVYSGRPLNALFQFANTDYTSGATSVWLPHIDSAISRCKTYRANRQHGSCHGNICSGSKKLWFEQGHSRTTEEVNV